MIKKLLLLLSLPLSLCFPMKIDRVILATDANPMYLDFWPLTAKVWEEVTGFRPTLALIADDSVPIDESLGDVIRFAPIEGIPTSLQAQVIRLLLPAYFPEDVCLISDIDMIPMQRSYFVDSVRECDEESFVAFRDISYQGPDIPPYPMCYLAGKGRVFQELFELNSIDSIAEKIKEWHSLNLGWSTDEKVVHRAIKAKEERMPISLLHHDVEKRVDRLYWHCPSDLVSDRYYIDAHLLRPYQAHKEAIDELVKTLLAKEATKGLPKEFNYWQTKDDDGSIFPWFTSSFLEVLKEWDISDWEILEYGCGYSTLWFANHCKQIDSIEDNPNWASAVKSTLSENKLDNYNLKQCSTKELYVGAIDETEKLYDCIIIDGIYRNECLEKALKHIKPGGILILDNSNQATCGFDNSPSLQLLSGYEHHSFLHPTHSDWRTDYWIIDEPKAKVSLNIPMVENRIVDWGYGTHVPPLITAVLNTSGPVLELGCGDFSTPLLHALCEKEGRFLLTCETDKDWMRLFEDLWGGLHHFQYIPCYEERWYGYPGVGMWDSVGSEMPRWSVVFIDHRPGERRVHDIQRLRSKVDIFVVHDTEQPFYGYEPVLETFKYRYTYKRYAIETTLVSDTIDVAKLFE